MTPDARLDVIDGKLDRAILHLESYRQTVEGFDRRIVELQKMTSDLAASSRRLADASLRLQAERNIRFLVAVVIAAVVGGVAAELRHEAFADRTLTHEVYR